MHKLVATAVLGIAVLTATPAMAAKQQQSGDVDLGSVTCAAFMKDLSTASEQDAGAIFLWLDGYLSGVSGDTVMRPAGMEQFVQALLDHCSKRGKDNLLDAARKVGING
jgi:acid stress chaperone HdeB